MTDETTSELLAEIDRDMADIERQVAELVEEAQQADYKTQELPEYTPPEGWRVVRFGEELLPGDVWVNEDGTEHRSNILQWDTSAVSGGRCIRRIKPEAQPESQWQPVPEPEPQPQPEQYTPPEGWRVLAVGEVLRDGDMWVWPTNDQLRQTVHVGAVVGANQRYIRPIEPQPQPEPQAQPQAAAIEELRCEVSYVQNLLGTERRRVTQLEELVASLRTINRGCENAVRDAGKENFALKNQLAAVKAELVTQAETSRRLQIELDAAQQVPADSPEIRQLWANLAEVAHDRDTYKHAHELLVQDIDATHRRTKAMTVEAIAEWLQPVRLVDNPNLANETLQHLPQIMRSLVGLDSPEDVD